MTMDPAKTLPLFSLLLLAVAILRLLELRVSRAHRAALAARGAQSAPEPHFRLMVMFHGAVLFAAGAEAWTSGRPASPGLALSMLALVVGATALRFWVIASLGVHWNVQIMDSVRLGVVDSGPFRWVRHPNYVAVFVELLALPLVHGAWATALAGAAVHAFVLYHRVRAEEAVLLADPTYRRVMGDKPRFVPVPIPRGRR
jgi:methyltransferase